MPQLQINQGPQDALLYDNTKSYFTNVGYQRTSNFQVEYRDIDPQNSGKQLGTTVQFVIPKAADLLGCTDLMVDFNECSGGSLKTVASWVECIGYAMIEKVVFSIGPNDIETITGEQLYIQNELMRGNNARYDKIIGKTGRSVLETECATDSANLLHTIMPHSNTGVDGGAMDHITEVPNHRVIHDGKAAGTGGAVKGRKLTIPLGLFFTKTVGNYFPLAAVAGCNEIRIAVKFRPYAELVQLHPEIDITDFTAQDKVLSEANNRLDGKATYASPATSLPSYTDHFKSLQLRCHYVHVTGPEATTLMNKEHVRLLKLWQENGQVSKTLTHTVTPTSGNIGDHKKGQTINIDLSFLHPVSELVIVVRRATDMNSEQTCSDTLGGPQKAKTKGRFNFHGDGREPSMDHPRNAHHNPTAPGNSTMLQTPTDPDQGTPVESATITMKNLKLTLNGQERHPGIDGSKGIDIEYLRDRILPMLHSNTSSQFESGTNTGYMGDETSPAAITTEQDFGYEPVGVKRLSQYLHQMQDRKNIFVYPFSINPEGANPSGAVNFSKVSHAKLTIEFDAWSSTSQEVDWVFDVYGTYYNWLQIKDGRGLLSFA
jgi:hypothetical protein